MDLLNQNLTSAVNVNKDTVVVVGVEKPYYLSGVAFEKLKNKNNSFTEWASIVFIAMLGHLYSVLSAYFKSGNITEDYYYPLVIGVGISIILFIIGLILPSERTKVMKDIKNHFEKNSKTNYLLTKEED